MNTLKTETIRAVYGSEHNECDAFIVHDIDDCGGKWYVIEGSQNVNYTMEDLSDGQDLELVEDMDVFTWKEDITSEGQAVEAVEA